MPAICLESCSNIKNILQLTDFPTPHNWLISCLECYDTVGWEGCEKWKNRSLLLTDEELKKDINLRDMQFIWGVFSAISTAYLPEELLTYPLPESETPHYMRNHIVPQHPLAFLEISIWDGCDTYITAHDENLLKPFYQLPYQMIDVEADNQRMNRILCKIQDMLRSMIPNVSKAIANEIQWICWHALFRNETSEVSDMTLAKEIQKAYHKVSANEYRFRYTLWNPYI